MRNETLHPTDGASQPRIAAPTVEQGKANLIDKYGRRITYIRLSVTDRCDFRCVYCMAEEMEFLPRYEILSLEECLRVVRSFVSLGVTKVRITGGEPLMRKDLTWLLANISALPTMKELVLTTNGSQLERFAGELRESGVKRLNISLDTLRPDRFKAITRIGDVHKVLRGIEAAKQAGFERIKLNTVMMRGVNDDEFVDLVRFACDNAIDIAFIEEMPLGDIGHGRQSTYFSSDDALALLGTQFNLQASSETTGGPAKYWRVTGAETRVGFISPHSHNFCESCNRVRVTAKGELYPCLGQNDAVALMPMLREHPNDEVLLRQTLVDAMGIKPLAHDFTAQMNSPQVVRFMSMTGG
jgi:GTP 3',8-cyclase